MPKVRIESNTTLAGEYELDTTYFTNRELHIIKKESGVRAGELGAALEAGDNDLIVALALIALQRNGKMTSSSAESLWDLPAGRIILDASDEDEVDASPPENGNSAETVPSGSDSLRSGVASPETSHPSSSGNPGSDTGLESAPATSGT